LQLGNGSNFGSIPGNVTDNGTLAFNHSDNITYSGIVSGTGSIAQNGPGTLVLAGNNTHSGGVSINGATLIVASDGKLGDPAGPVTINAGTFQPSAPLSTNRTFTVNSGTLDGTNALTIAGTGNTTLSGNVNVAGTVSFNRSGGTVAVAPASSITVPSGATLNVDGNSISSDGTHAVSIVANGNANLPGNATVGNLTGSGNVVLKMAGANLAAAINTAGGATSVTSLAMTGKIDLNNNSLIVNYTGSSPAAAIRTQLQAGFVNNWSGASGIVSSVANADASMHHTLAYADASELGLTSLGGKSITGTAVVVKYTYAGDSNLDGIVDLSNDFSLFIDGYNKQTSNPSSLNPGNLWVNGDYNYDGTIDLNSDFALFVASYSAFNQSPTQLAQLDSIINSMDLTTAQKNHLLSVVPEPTSLGMLALGAGMLGLRRKRKA